MVAAIMMAMAMAVPAKASPRLMFWSSMMDTVDADEVVLGLGKDTGGLSLAQTNRLLRDLGRAADVVGLTIAEYIPRQVIALTDLLHGLPLL